MAGPRSLIPRPGNAARPVFFFLLGSFGLMLVGFPILMYAVGLGTASIVWITLLILAVTVGILWFTVRLGQDVQKDEEKLDAGDLLAEWTISEREHRAFVAGEHRSRNRRVAFFALLGAVLGLGYWFLAKDALAAWIMFSVFLLAAVVNVFTGPPRSARDETARQVRIGPNGVHSLGRYQPFRMRGLQLRRVDLEHGDPSILRFSVRSGRRSAYNTIQVPVPADNLHEAKAVLERLRRDHDL